MKKLIKVLFVSSSLLFSHTSLASSIGFLGPVGTYSDQATQLYLSKNTQITKSEALSSLSDIVQSVADGKITIGLLPYYATVSGFPLEAWKNLTDKLDLGIRISDEVVMPVVSELLVKPGTQKSQITKIASHPNALKEASNYLGQDFKDVALTETASTAAAAKAVAEGDGSIAAVAGPAAGKLFGLEIFAANIQDDKDNATSFWILKPKSHWVRPEMASTLVIAIDVKPNSSTLTDTVEKLSKDKFNVALIHCSSIPGKIFTNRYVIVAKNSDQHKYPQTEHFLTTLGTYGLLLGAY